MTKDGSSGPHGLERAPNIDRGRAFGHENQGHVQQVVHMVPPAPRVLPFIAHSPYCGLQAFRESETHLFFGREDWTAKLLAAVQAHGFTLLTGASGVGKSSLVRAGLLPRLRALHPSRSVRVLELKPDRDPFTALWSALTSGPDALPAQEAWEAQRPSPNTLLKMWLRLRQPNQTWFVFVDQAEELFTLCTDEQRRTAFIDGLLQLWQRGGAEVRIVMALRADFLDRLDGHPGLAALLLDRLLFMTSPDKDALHACIEQPARMHGVKLEPGLLEMLLEDVDGRPGVLPLLEFTLDRLWLVDQPADDRTLSIASYRGLGSVMSALSQYAETLYQQVCELTQRGSHPADVIRRALLRLVEVSGDGAGAKMVRRRVLLTEFSPAERHLLQHLATHKLLTLSGDLQTGTATVELVHEALLTAWDRLRDWIEESRVVLSLHGRLIADARRWHRTRKADAARASDELWQGARLQQIEELQARGELQSVIGDVGALEQAFLEASLQRRQQQQHDAEAQRAALVRAEIEKQRQRNRQLRITIVSLVLILLIVGGLALRTWQAQRQAGGTAGAQQLEAGRLEALSTEKAVRALPRYLLAQRAGSQDPMLPYLRGESVRAAELLRATLVDSAGRLRSAAFSADGRRIVTASEKGTAQVFDAASGKALFTLPSKDTGPIVATFHADGKRIVTSNEAGDSVHYFDAENGQLLTAIRESATRVTVEGRPPDEPYRILAGKGPDVRIWDLQKGALHKTLSGHHGRVHPAQFNASKTRLLSASDDGTATIWSVDSGQPLLRISGGWSKVQVAKFSPDDRRILIGTSDAVARLYDAYTGALLHELRPPGASPDELTAWFSPDGTSVATMTPHDGVWLWEVATGKAVRQWKARASAVTIAQLPLFTADSLHLVVVASDGWVHDWDIERARERSVTLWGPGSFAHPALSTDGKTLAVVGGDRGSAQLWDLERGLGPRLHEVDERIDENLAFSRDGKSYLTVDGQGSAVLREHGSGRPLRTFKGHDKAIVIGHFSGDGKWLLTQALDDTVRIWDLMSGSLRRTYRDGSPLEGGAQMSTDGHRVITLPGDHRPILHDPITGRRIAVLEGHTDRVSSARFSLDGKRLVTASRDQTWRIWDADSGRQRIVLKNIAGLPADHAFSPDGKRLVAGDCLAESRVARVWDSDSGKQLLELSGHDGPICSAQFSPDGGRIATSGLDHTVRLFDAQTGRLRRTLSGNQQQILDVAFSPDGGRIATSGLDGMVRVFDADSGRLILSRESPNRWPAALWWSPDGHRIAVAAARPADDQDAASQGSHKRAEASWPVQIWEVAADTHDAAYIDKLLRCRVPYRLVDDALLPSPLDLRDCSGLQPPPPMSRSFFDRHAPLLRGVTAIKTAAPEVAGLHFAEAESTYRHFNDGEGMQRTLLAHIAVAHATKRTIDATGIRRQVAGLVEKSLSGADARAERFFDLGGFAAESLDDLELARWGMNEALRVRPGWFAPRVSLLEIDLASDLAAPVLERAEETFLDLPADATGRAAVAGVLFLAAQRADNAAMSRRWAQQTIDEYGRLPQDGKTGWVFDGLRGALQRQTGAWTDAALSRSLRMLDLLELPRSADREAELRKILVEAAPPEAPQVQKQKSPVKRKKIVRRVRRR